MKTVTKPSFARTAITAMSLLGLVAMSAPHEAQAVALTSANATIHNAVTVVYTAGSATKYVTSKVNITVTTLASPATVYSPTGLSVYAGANASYNGASTYIVRSTSNGPDTYTVSALTQNIIGGTVAAATPVSNTPSVSLWGGYVIGVGAAGSNVIKIPAGSEAGLVEGSSTIEFDVSGTMRRYTVTTITAGTAADTPTNGGLPTDAAPTTTGESYTLLTLTPVGHAITADTAAVGTQAGEYKSLDVVFTAGAPTTSGTDGDYNTTFTLTTATKLSDNTLATTNVTGVHTTVYSPAVTIVKASRNATTGGVFKTDNTTTARPGEVLEYQITVSNTHASATVSNVSISDAVPAYTAALAGQYAGSDVQIDTTVSGVTTTTYGTFGDNADTAYLNAGKLVVTMGTGAGDAKTPTGGAIAHGDSVVIKYKVTVQ